MKHSKPTVCKADCSCSLMALCSDAIAISGHCAMQHMFFLRLSFSHLGTQASFAIILVISFLHAANTKASGQILRETARERASPLFQFAGVDNCLCGFRHKVQVEGPESPLPVATKDRCRLLFSASLLRHFALRNTRRALFSIPFLVIIYTIIL